MSDPEPPISKFCESHVSMPDINATIRSDEEYIKCGNPHASNGLHQHYSSFQGCNADMPAEPNEPGDRSLIVQDDIPKGFRISAAFRDHDIIYPISAGPPISGMWLHTIYVCQKLNRLTYRTNEPQLNSVPRGGELADSPAFNPKKLNPPGVGCLKQVGLPLWHFVVLRPSRTCLQMHSLCLFQVPRAGRFIPDS